MANLKKVIEYFEAQRPEVIEMTSDLEYWVNLQTLIDKAKKIYKIEQVCDGQIKFFNDCAKRQDFNLYDSNYIRASINSYEDIQEILDAEE